MKLEEAIGARIRQAREAKGMSQAALGKLLGEYLGEEWTRQGVWQAERGKRVLKARELLAFSNALDISMNLLFTPRDSGALVTLGDGPGLPAVALPAHFDGDEVSKSDAEGVHLALQELDRAFLEAVKARDALDAALTKSGQAIALLEIYAHSLSTRSAGVAVKKMVAETSKGRSRRGSE